MQSNSIILAYKGNITDDFFGCILHLVENKLQKIELRAKVRKKVFNVLVEILQNIYHYFDELKEEGKENYSVVFLLSKEGEEYFIFTGNHVKKERMRFLKKKIDRINALNSDELKLMYRNRLKNGSVNKNGGAGLGILDIVRKSGTKINYDFKLIDDHYSFFSLNVRVCA